MTVPISRILIAPDPALSGAALQVYPDDGPKYPGTPFTALIWYEGYVPNSVNSEEVTVTSVDGDVLTVLRSMSPIELQAGMMIAATDVVPIYEIGEDVTVSHDFSSHDPPYILVLHSPSGEVGAFGSATGVIDDGNGFAAFNFDLSRGGIWHYRWESASELGPEGTLFAKFSPTRS